MRSSFDPPFVPGCGWGVLSGCADWCLCRSAAGFDEGYAQDDYLRGQRLEVLLRGLGWRW